MRRVLIFAFLALLLGSCSGGASGSARYTLGEFFINGPAMLADTGDGITVENSGEYSHTLVVTRPDGQVVAASGLVGAGETITLDFDLEPGAYQFTCRIVGQDGEGRLIDHYERGMHTAVSVGG